MAHAKHDSLRVLLFILGRFYCYRQSHVYDLHIVIIVTDGIFANLFNLHNFQSNYNFYFEYILKFVIVLESK